ncbi:MAG: DUF933 domain-containing protein [bacterium]
MKVGIMGLKGSGKTTIFNSLTGLTAKTGGYSSGEEVNLGLIKVPDKRIDTLSDIFKPKKTIYAEITFADIVMPLEKNISTSILEKLKYMDALAFVIRGFNESQVDFHPMEDITNLYNELILSDLAIAEKTLPRLKKERKDPLLIELMEKIYNNLNEEKPLSSLEMDERGLKLIVGYAFLSIKPILVVINTSESGLDEKLYTSIQGYCKANNMGVMKLAGSLEEEISQLSPEEQGGFLKEMGLEESARERFIRESYEMLKLISFFTVGEDEVRAWTIKKGDPAVKAAGKIHSDIERGFIRAEVVSYTDFITYKNLAEVKKHGLLRLEGKEYQVQDGDIINFRFNV